MPHFFEKVSEKDRPIATISRSLNQAEENYATIEKEKLAIEWALDNLRSFFYGAGSVQVFTDHQPLMFALSHINLTAKFKRWKAVIEEYGGIYKPGEFNGKADAFRRNATQIHYIGSDSATTAEVKHHTLPTIVLRIL